MNKIILTDVDGVLIDWVVSFKEYLKANGHSLVPGHDEHYAICKWLDIPYEEAKAIVQDFNESDAIRDCVPLRDAVKYVTKLHKEHGFKFHAITSISLDPRAKLNRQANLETLFGDAFEQVVCLDCGADKDEELAKYTNTEYFWIEDKPENAEVGVEFGLKSILVRHDHNADHVAAGVTPVDTWKEIYEIILNEN